MVKSISLFQSQRETKNHLAFFVMGTLSLHLILCFGLLLLYGAYARLSRKPAPTLVQLVDGAAIKTAPLDAQERTPDTVRHFVSSTLTLMLNWSGKLPNQAAAEAQSPQLDPGIPVAGTPGSEKRVATTAWQATFALSETFRSEFLRKLAELTPTDVFSGETQVVLVPLEISYPEKIATGKWKVRLVANLLVVSRHNNVGTAIPFNKEIFVQAIDTPNPPAETTPLAKAIYAVRQAGLEIYAIRDLTRENL